MKYKVTEYHETRLIYHIEADSEHEAIDKATQLDWEDNSKETYIGLTNSFAEAEDN